MGKKKDKNNVKDDKSNKLGKSVSGKKYDLSLT